LPWQPERQQWRDKQEPDACADYGKRFYNAFDRKLSPSADIMGRLEKNTWKLGEKKESKKATLSPFPGPRTRKANGPRCFGPLPHAYPEQTPYKQER